MSVQVSPSRLLRLALLDRFLAEFNNAVGDACEEFGVPVYGLNFDPTQDLPQNFYEGNRSLEALNLYREPELPCATMWMGEGGQYGPGQRSTPTVFSGVVVAHWRFFLGVRGRVASGLVDLREATESAMIATLNPEFPGFNYHGDLAWPTINEQVWMDQGQDQSQSVHIGFIQEIEYTASFDVDM